MATCIEYAVYFVPNRHTENECAVYLRKEREAMNKNSKKFNFIFYYLIIKLELSELIEVNQIFFFHLLLFF